MQEDEFGEIRALRAQFMRAVYDLRDAASGMVGHDEIMQRMALTPSRWGPDYERYADIAQYFDGLGYIRRVADGYGIVAITTYGIRYVEGDLEQHAAMNNVSFDFQTVEAELDRAEEEVEQRGGRDEAELKELIAEVRALHAGGEPLNRGRLAKYLGVIQRNGWIASPIAGTLLSVATGAS